MKKSKSSLKCPSGQLLIGNKCLPYAQTPKKIMGGFACDGTGNYFLSTGTYNVCCLNSLIALGGGICCDKEGFCCTADGSCDENI